MLSTAVTSWLYPECVVPRGPTYPGCSTRINMLLDTTRVQCSASGDFYSLSLPLSFSWSPFWVGNSCNFVLSTEKNIPGTPNDKISQMCRCGEQKNVPGGIGPGRNWRRGCHPCEWITPSISPTFSVSMSDGVKSSSGDLWIFTQDSWPTDVTLIFLWGW